MASSADIFNSAGERTASWNRQDILVAIVARHECRGAQARLHEAANERVAICRQRGRLQEPRGHVCDPPLICARGLSDVSRELDYPRTWRQPTMLTDHDVVTISRPCLKNRRYAAILERGRPGKIEITDAALELPARSQKRHDPPQSALVDSPSSFCNGSWKLFRGVTLSD